MFDYETVMLDGRPHVELFDARSGIPLAFQSIPAGLKPHHVATLMILVFEAPSAIVAEVK